MDGRREEDHGLQVSARCRRREGGVDRVGERLPLFVEMHVDELPTSKRFRGQLSIESGFFARRGGSEFLFLPSTNSQGSTNGGN
jgi:hypothetical protein